MLDTERGLFAIADDKSSLVLRIQDLLDYDIDFKGNNITDGLLGAKVTGDEFMTITMGAPNIYYEAILKRAVNYKAKPQGVLSSKYLYDFSQEFSNVIRAFSIMVYAYVSSLDDTYQENIGEIEKALALFMFDSMDEVTEENLKKQRNALIKAFHPDANGDIDATYSQKINDAYSLLNKMVEEKNKK